MFALRYFVTQFFARRYFNRAALAPGTLDPKPTWDRILLMEPESRTLWLR